MKFAIKGKDNSEIGKVEVPGQFEEGIRKDLIKRAYLAACSRKRASYGAAPEAGMQHVAKLSRRRRKYRGSYGYGISRVPRKILSRNGTRFNWRAAEMPGTVGGRRAHPPKADKVWAQKINRKERRKAIRSALAAVVDVETVQGKGHRVPDGYPFALADEFESYAKTKEVVNALLTLGFDKELERTRGRRIKSGRGTRRGRKYKRSVGPLLVVSEECALMKAGRNIPGIDVATVDKLHIDQLAPGSHPGRATLFSKKALERLKEEKLYM